VSEAKSAAELLKTNNTVLPQACARRRGPHQARFWFDGVEEAERMERAFFRSL
jgi:hypothetical protein